MRSRAHRLELRTGGDFPSLASDGDPCRVSIHVSWLAVTEEPKADVGPCSQ